MKEIESEEKSFLRFLETALPAHGVFGKGNQFVNGKLVKGDQRMLIVGKSFNQLYQSKPAFVRGNFTPEAKAKLEKYGFTNERIHTETTVDQMIANLMVSHSIQWYGQFYEGTYPNQRRLTPEEVNVEPNSLEFDALNEARGAYQHRKKQSKYGETLSKDDTTVQYHMFGIGFNEKKHTVDKAIEWYKTNTSITPLQDAMQALLKIHGHKLYKVIPLGCELPVMKDVDYTPWAEIKAQHDAEFTERRAKMTDGQRAELRALAERLKNKV